MEDKSLLVRFVNRFGITPTTVIVVAGLWFFVGAKTAAVAFGVSVVAEVILLLKMAARALRNGGE